MSMNAGTAALETGSLSKAIYDQLGVQFGAPPADQVTNRAKASAAIAAAVVSHLGANADVRISTSNAGLQRDPSTGTATLAPSSAVVLPGALE